MHTGTSQFHVEKMGNAHLIKDHNGDCVIVERNGDELTIRVSREYLDSFGELDFEDWGDYGDFVTCLKKILTN